jgi:hypothetical protein
MRDLAKSIAAKIVNWRLEVRDVGYMLISKK